MEGLTDNPELTEIELERQIKKILEGTDYVCMVFPKDLTIEHLLKQLKRKK